MNLYNQAFEQALNQNALNDEIWRNYKENVNETRENVNTFLKSCKLDILVPIGKKAFIRGTLQHTNDILVSHNSNYFSLVSNFQANEILNHRNEICDKRLMELNTERDLYRDKLDVPKNDVFSEHEIIEEYNEETETEWKIKHRASVKKYKQQEADERKMKTDGEIDNLLDQYELMEEMAGELENLEGTSDYDYNTLLKFISGEEKIVETKTRVSHEAVAAQGTNSLANTHKDQERVLENENCIDSNVSSMFKSNEKFQESKIEIEKSSSEASKTKKNRRKVRFSTSLEDVKIIEPARYTSEHNSFPPIQINFYHSDEKFNPDFYNNNDDDVIFKHPGEISTKIFTSNVDSEQLVKKSILKETNYKYENHTSIPHSVSNKVNDDEEVLESLSKFPLICGDVVERKFEEENVKPSSESSKSGKKISKFKELRNKVK